MKALHVTYQFGLRCAGGAAIAATRMHYDLLRRGVDSRVVCVWGDGDAVSCLRTGWWWFLARALHLLTGKWTHGLDLPGFDRLVREFKPDEVHIHWIRRDTISWRQLRRLGEGVGEGGQRLFVHLHDLWPLVQMQITSLNPTFVAYSDWVHDRVKNLGYRVERRNLILDPAYTNPLLSNSHTLKLSHPQTLKTPPPPKFLLFGCKDGRANPDKGFSDLAKALALLPGEVKRGLELRVFGEVSAECETSGVRTVFLGRIDDPAKLRDAYRAASCFVFPSVHETMGMTKLEALACGCPVVAFDREACAEGIVHGKTGYAAKDVADFARGIQWALERTK